MALVVKNSFTHHSDEGGVIIVLADSPTEPVPGQDRIRMVAEDAFDIGTPQRAYVEMYGILVGPENLRERADTEIDIYRGWELHEDANGAWATNGRVGGHVVARRADQLYDLIDEHDEHDERDSEEG